MSGITGWVSFGRDLTSQRNVIQDMTDTMSSRGPDDTGIWLSPCAALGHRRLAVIDLPGGTQPMQVSTPEGRIVIVYSGETYNYTELRGELRFRGHHFGSDSDTEVVLRSYLEWGEALADRINGMYAFAIWDGRSEKVVMVRDRLGVKPFYYYETADGILFGSEPKAILANPCVEPVVGADGLREMFTQQKTPGVAIYEGMRELRLGHIAVLDRNGLREWPYWQLEVTEHTDSLVETIQHVRGLLDDIVARQLVAEVPLCTLLSGGLDSSTLTALAARQLAEQGETVRSFAVDFTNQPDNFQDLMHVPNQDPPYVHLVADHVASEHSDIVLTGTEMADPMVRRAIVTARDFANGVGDRDNSLYLLFKEIRCHATVALSGESADEIFGGYPWFHNDEQRWADTFPWLTMPVASPYALLDKGLVEQLDIDSYVRDNYLTALKQAPLKEDETKLERRMRQLSFMHLTRLVQTQLDRKDRLSMAAGLEVRVPFCDYRLVQYVFNTPWSLKAFDGREKSLLRAATSDVVPNAVAYRKKSGYPGNLDPNYLRAVQRQVSDLITADHAALQLYDRDKLKAAAEANAETITGRQRTAIERCLDMAQWFDVCNPRIKFD